MSVGKRGIARRGPDHTGHFAKSFEHFRLGLIHSRLSILCPTLAASQPMYSPCGRWVMSFNGEIFNYVELRAELVELGWSFVTTGDSEVLLAAWCQWGERCLSKLNGMFAVCFLDRKERRLFLVRDRFGIKPLYFGEKDQFCFGSSVASIAEILGASPCLDYLARGLHLGAYEGNFGDPSQESPFTGVIAVRPGTLVQVDFAGPRISHTTRTWYDLRASVRLRESSIRLCSAAELTQEVKSCFQSAVELRLRSDVEYAVSLSGGLDSSAIAATVRQSDPGIVGFTYGSPDAARSEGATVARFCSDKKIHPHYVWPKNSAKSLEDLLWRTMDFQEAPFTGLSILAQNAVFESARAEGYKVLLGGQGSDEIFAGYRKFFAFALREALSKRSVGDSASFIGSLGRLAMVEFSRGGASMLERVARYLPSRRREPGLLNLPDSTVSLWSSEDQSLQSRQIDDMQRFSIPTLLRYEDRNSMGHGLETRLPFMDYRLVELALALPARMKIYNGYGKWKLREITEPQVPDYIRLDRDKRGFDVTQNWIRDGLGKALCTRVLDSRAKITDYVRDFSLLERTLRSDRLDAEPARLREVMSLAWLCEPISSDLKKAGRSPGDFVPGFDGECTGEQDAVDNARLHKSAG